MTVSLKVAVADLIIMALACCYNATTYSVKGMYNPTKLLVPLSRKTKFYPYIFGQGNLIQINPSGTQEQKSTISYDVTTGIGITGDINDFKVVNLRTYLQLGYNMPLHNTTTNFANALLLQFKVGIGINMRRVKSLRESRKRKVSEQEI